MQRVKQENLNKVAKILKCYPNYTDVLQTIIRECPSINSGRKDSNDLVSELMNGEASLEYRDGRLIRVVNVLELAIFLESEQNYVLIEKKMMWKNTGDIVERNVYPAKKISDGQNLSVAAYTLLQRELNIEPSEVVSIGAFGSRSRIENRKSAYKITSDTLLSQYEVILNSLHTKSMEYMSDTPEKTVTYSWMKIS